LTGTKARLCHHGISANGMGDLKMCKGDVEAYIGIVGRFNGIPGKQDNGRPHSAHAKTVVCTM